MTFQDQFFAGKTRPWKADSTAPPARTPAARTEPPSIPAQPTKKLPQTIAAVSSNKTTLAYWALLIFSFLYFARPNDFIPGMDLIPVAKISGGIALLGLLLSWNRRREKLPLEIKLVLVLLLYFCLTIPFAFWRGGAFEVVKNQCSKAAIVALLTSMIVSKLPELRRLLWVQAASIAVMTAASVILHPGVGLRMKGLGGEFSNPNDLAIIIAINLPLAFAFLLGTKRVLGKLAWSVALLVMIYGVIATYSRSGFISMTICFVICVWEFGVRLRRPVVLIGAVLMVTLGVGAAITSPRYVLRLKTLVGGDTRGTLDKGSLDARQDLLIDSIHVTLEHPIFGVGPGNFQAYTKSWHVTHNTYTELSSEAGIPALLIFLTIMGLSFRNLARIRKYPSYKNDPQLQLYMSAMRASIPTYMVGAAFASTSYLLYPYFLIAYVSALHKVASSPQLNESQEDPKSPVETRNTRNSYGQQQAERPLAWTR